MMRVVVALGGRALLPPERRGSVEKQRAAIAEACTALAWIAQAHELVVSHDQGPHAGLLCQDCAAHDQVSEYPASGPGAASDAMNGVLVELELANRLGDARAVSTLARQTEVDPADPSFAHPTHFVGPPHFDDDADVLSQVNGWVMRRDGGWMRRVVAAPRPVRILDRRPISWLLEKGAVVLCAGGGGMPAVRLPERQAQRTGEHLVAVEGVIDHDLSCAVLARDLDADLLVMATDVDTVLAGLGGPDERALIQVHPDDLDPADFSPASMGPKIAAAVQFAGETGRPAVIGSLRDVEGLLAGTRGTTVTGSAAPATEPLAGAGLRWSTVQRCASQ